MGEDSRERPRDDEHFKTQGLDSRRQGEHFADDKLSTRDAEFVNQPAKLFSRSDRSEPASAADPKP